MGPRFAGVTWTVTSGVGSFSDRAAAVKEHCGGEEQDVPALKLILFALNLRSA